jgi:ribosome biogenesis GTPase
MVPGFNERVASEAASYPGTYPGRVVSQSKTLYRVLTERGELLAQVSGRLRQSAVSQADYPAVGDFVMLDRADGAGGNAVILHLLPRTSIFVRKAAGSSHDNQAVAANVDTVFICMGMDRDFNLRRLEIYLSVAWDSGAALVVVLTKSDACENPAEKAALAESVCIGADVIITSALHEGADMLKPYICGRTVAFIGSSGVGKSTLINRLAGEDMLKTGETSDDGRGRHTTTSRELIPLCGGAVIDTPGMREMGIESADFSLSFSDIDELAGGCRFRDCSHMSEPGCAVLSAVEEGPR